MEALCNNVNIKVYLCELRTKLLRITDLNSGGGGIFQTKEFNVHIKIYERKWVLVGNLLPLHHVTCNIRYQIKDMTQSG